MYFLYSLISLVVLVVLSPWFLYQAIRHKKYLGSLGQRLGYLPLFALMFLFRPAMVLLLTPAIKMMSLLGGLIGPYQVAVAPGLS